MRFFLVSCDDHDNLFIRCQRFKRSRNHFLRIFYTITIKFKTVELKFYDLLDTSKTATSTFQFLSILRAVGAYHNSITWIRRVVLYTPQGCTHCIYYLTFVFLFPSRRRESYTNLYTCAYLLFIGVYRVHISSANFFSSFTNSSEPKCRKYI